MSGITLSASVRQNLLSLQSTADLLSTTQNRLSTGNKVNSALDNPTNFFTASALNSRSSDINNLLDGIGNGVQILQAANTGITSIQKLVDSAKSIANQALQTTVGYTKSSVTSVAVSGATASNLLGDGTLSAAFTGTAATGTATAAFGSTTAAAGSQLYSAAATAATGATLLSGLTDVAGTASGLAANDTLTINGKTITFGATGALAGSGTAYTLGINATVTDLAAAIDTLQGTTGTATTGGKLTLNTGTTANLAVTGSAGVLAKLGLSAAGANTATRTGGTVTSPALATATKLSGTDSTGALSSSFAAGDTLTVNGKILTFTASGASGANQIDITSDVASLLSKIDALSGGTGSTVTGGKVVLNTGTASDLSVTSSNAGALAALGLGTGVTQARTSPIQGQTLTIGATGAGGVATNITFGTGANQVDTLDELNTALASNNLQASLDTTGKLSITTTNDYASSSIGTIGGTSVTAVGGAFKGQTVATAQADPASQATRASLIAQYNQVIDQITTTAADSSFNGVNLLNGDTLKLTFNETGTSKLSISGVGFGPGGLGLSKLTAGTDFTDNAAVNKTLSSLTTAATTLRSQASSFGSNLSVVQIRQDFSKNLINVLTTGASNLTLADTNEEAANSQALSTRQSIGVSALSLANTAQQGVLQLLR
ncbi:MAG: flagellar hook protein [Tardiphaga sp.]|nr:flagellar hook protein [Tardiphaga sp.]